VTISRRHLVRFVAHTGELAELRARVGELLAAVPADSRADVLLSIDEAASNALTHTDGAGVMVHVAIEATKVTATVIDWGKGFDVVGLVDTWPPSSQAGGGRGIYLIATLMDTVTFDVGGGTIVHMTRELAGNGHCSRPRPTMQSNSRVRFGTPAGLRPVPRS
jgi:anti-sigma regulatory factor (Ser/Thr protein kinase)